MKQQAKHLGATTTSGRPLHKDTITDRQRDFLVSIAEIGCRAVLGRSLAFARRLAQRKHPLVAIGVNPDAADAVDRHACWLTDAGRAIVEAHTGRKLVRDVQDARTWIFEDEVDWNAEAARIQEHTVAQGREPEPNLTGESLRAQTVLSDEIVEDLVAEDARRGRFVIQIVSVTCGGGRIRPGMYVARSGSSSSYTPLLEKARIFTTLGEAERNACENERVVDLDSLLGGG